MHFGRYLEKKSIFRKELAERSKRKKVKRKRIDEVDRNWRQMVGGRFEN